MSSRRLVDQSVFGEFRPVAPYGTALPFAIVLSTERTEAVLHGLYLAFDFFAAVPKELW